MTRTPPAAEAEAPSVQVELTGAATPRESDDEQRSRENRLGPRASAVIVAVVLGALWLLVRPTPGTDAASAPLAPPPAPAPPDSVVTDGRSVDRSVPIPRTGIAEIVTFQDGFVAAGEAEDDRGGVTVLSSSDAYNWTTLGRLDGVDRVLSLRARSDSLRAFTATVTDGSTLLEVHTSADGSTWRPESDFNEIRVPEVVLSGSLRGDRWVVVAAGSTLAAAPGRLTPGSVMYAGDRIASELRIQIAPDELVDSYAASESGFVASFVRRLPTANGPRREVARLARWTANWGMQDMSSTIGEFESTPRVVDGDQVGVIVGPQFYTAAGIDGQTWRPVLVAPPGLPELHLARAGADVLARPIAADGPARIAISSDGFVWRFASVSGGLPELLAVADDHAVLVVGSAVRRLERVPLEARRPLSELQSQAIVVRR